MALFDTLNLDKHQVTFADTEQDDALSVCEHLTALLNARRGVLKHLPDYGLPDVEDIYEGLPYSQHTLALEVKRVIEKYEPRIKHALVRPLEIKGDNCVICLEIHATLSNGHSIRLSTRFASGGEASVVGSRQ